MVLSPQKSNNNEGWGMGLLFIFFHNPPSSPSHPIEDIPTKKKPSLSLTSSSSSNLLLSKTQSTLSICALFLFTTLLLFTLSSFEPSSSSSSSLHHRRFLQDSNLFLRGTPFNSSLILPALQGMGQLYFRGSKSMSDLIVAHLSPHLSAPQLRSFLRLLQHSGLLSRTDLLFVFPSSASAARFGPLLKSECDLFLRLVQLGKELGGSRSELGAGLTRYLRVVGEEDKEPIWGKKRGNSTLSTGVESTRPSYGSVVGFYASELDPEDTLAGFLDHVPMSLRRWACYPMLLGRVRRNFKHIMLVDATSTLVLSDPFSRVRNRSSESVVLWSNSVQATESTRHGRRSSGKARPQEQRNNNVINPGVIIGGSRGVRRFANAAVTEIVRVIIEHKGKSRNSVSESGLVNQLVHSGHLLKNINLITPTESIPESGSLSGLNSGRGLLGMWEYFSVVQRGGKGDVDDEIMKAICKTHKLYSSVYSDCLASQHTSIS